jgi:hypothetical protein
MVRRMTQHLPIACTLNAADFAEREALITELGRDALLSAHRDGARAELRFAAASGIRERVDAFVDGEKACCAFLTMDVADHGAEIVLTIGAPTDAEPAVTELVAAFQPETQAA